MDLFLLHGKHRSRSAKPRGDFVDDQQDVVPFAEAGHLRQIAFRHQQHSAGALNERFHHHGGHFRMMLLQLFFDFLNVARNNGVSRKQQVVKAFVKQLHPAYRNGSNGVSVITLF